MNEANHALHTVCSPAMGGFVAGERFPPAAFTAGWGRTERPGRNIVRYWSRPAGYESRRLAAAVRPPGSGDPDPTGRFLARFLAGFGDTARKNL
ncbi:MAG TPA: hypothetical protein ENN17_00510 [bacterium]|nr:hypothetical protein [bacterium]